MAFFGHTQDDAVLISPPGGKKNSRDLMRIAGVKCRQLRGRSAERSV
jgi:hypothetical protein